MSHKLVTLSQNEHGQLLRCKICQTTQLYFNNIYLEFDQREFEAFKSYIERIDITFFESYTNNTFLKRKIIIPTMQRNLALTFGQQELELLKDLVFENTIGPDATISASEIDYIQILN
ncbi:MAG: DUF6686 family protein [Bacteroidota bacterium]